MLVMLSLSLALVSASPAKDARDERSSLSARKAAIVVLRQEDALAAALAELRLVSAAGQERARARVIRRLSKMKTRVEDLKKADSAFAMIQRLVKRQRIGRALTKRQQKEVGNAIKAWRGYRALDPVREGHAMLNVAALYERAGDTGRAHRIYQGLARFRVRSRDASPVRQRARRARAELFEASGRWREAARESFRADQELKALGPSADEVKARDYRRSRATAELCARARASGVSCARLQGRARTFYDFSLEKTRGFSKQRAAVVNAEFGDLLARCVHNNARHARGATVQVDWKIGHDGRVEDGRIYRPTRLRATPMGACIQDAFARYRYPRYGGEVHRSMLEWYVPERG